MVTTVEIADRLNVAHPTVLSWAAAWHGRVGSGHRRRLALVDLYVARAWAELGAPTGRAHHYGSPYGSATLRMRVVESAIRANPRRWLLLTGERLAETHDTAEAAARAWLVSGVAAATVIDLWSVPV